MLKCPLSMAIWVLQPPIHFIPSQKAVVSLQHCNSISFLFSRQISWKAPHIRQNTLHHIWSPNVPPSPIQSSIDPHSPMQPAKYHIIFAKISNFWACFQSSVTIHAKPIKAMSNNGMCAVIQCYHISEYDHYFLLSKVSTGQEPSLGRNGVDHRAVLMRWWWWYSPNPTTILYACTSTTMVCHIKERTRRSQPTFDMCFDI